MSIQQRGVLTDIDGVFFELVDHEGEFGVSARTHDELRLITGLEDSLKRLREKDYLILGVTNQPDIARGKITRDFLRTKHHMLLEMYPQIAKVFCCEHTDNDLCSCRKPKPGLMFEAAAQFGLDLSRSWVVGDSRSDIEAGITAHTRTVFVQTRYNVADPALRAATFVARSPKDAFESISAFGDVQPKPNRSHPENPQKRPL